MSRTVDRPLARMIAYKRIVTGTLGLSLGPAMLVLGISRGGTLPPALWLAVALLACGGAWALRDGLRLRRALAR